MSAERREALLAAAARHAAKFDEVARRRHGGVPLRVVPRPAPTPQAISKVHAPSPRKLEVLRLMAEGFTNQSIAARLGISEETVKTYVKDLGQILGSKNRTHTVSLAYRAGLLDVEPSGDLEL